MRIIAIGNGSSVTEKKLGYLIDSDYDIVVRFNRGYIEAIDKYPEYVGKKTDILVIHDGYAKPEYLSEKIFSDVTNIFVAIPAFKFENEISRIFSYGSAYKKNIGIIPKSIEFEINKISDFGNSWPSTGLIGISYLCSQLKDDDTLTLFGFDGWNMKYKYYHYFDNEEDRTTEHAWRKNRSDHKLSTEIEVMNYLRKTYNLKDL